MEVAAEVVGGYGKRPSTNGINARSQKEAS
jgi:hypothetical protein